MPDCVRCNSHAPADPRNWAPYFSNFLWIRESLTPPPRPDRPWDQVFIGHMDTGFVRSAALLDLSRLELGESRDLLAPWKDDAETPTELLPVRSGSSEGNYHNHGTATLSVLIGAGALVPAVPDVKIIPYRVCTRPHLLGYTELALKAAAIAHFVTSVEKTLQQPPPHVVAMSLGTRGPTSMGKEFVSGKKILIRTIMEFKKRGVIFVAASGQIPDRTGLERVKTPFPASMKEVISVAAIDRQSVPNPAGFYGGPIDIVAPGVNVRMGRAYRTNDNQIDPVVEQSSGSSYATQFTAAAAALWIEHHGKDFLTRTYGLDLITDLFRFCLRRSGDPSHPAYREERTYAPKLNVDCLLRMELPTKAELEAALP